MTVGELIDKLMVCEDDAIVTFRCNDDRMEVTSVDIYCDEVILSE